MSAAPLEGVRVVDLGWTWAGPYAGMILADLGADVIKVESSRRIDILRWSGAFADGLMHHERSGYYTACNRGKRSVSLDLKHPAAVELVLDLVRGADVVIENFAPRVLPSLGLGWETLSAVNERLVMVSLSAFGATGPQHDNVSYGDHLLYTAGMAAITGHPDDPPTPLGTFYGDPVAGMYGALAVLAGLAERDRTGRGRRVDFSQAEGLVSMLAPQLLAASAGSPPERLGDKSPLMAPHGFYRCAGDDTWVAIAVETDAGWAALRSLLAADGIDAPEAPTLADRKAVEGRIDDDVRTWTASRSPWQVTVACQDRGIAAYPVMSAPRLLWDEHLHERDFFERVTHPVNGPGPIPGVVFRVGERGARARGPAPLLGEHTEEILLGELGIDRDRFDSLAADGAIA